jgi:predicted RNA-binding Zn-ribbon protein involved in translation (DUF1610 family)
MTFSEREELFARARRAEGEAPSCPDCGRPLARQIRCGAGGTDYCENCGWEAPPF